jgi:tRNA A-37 threonylcarbamoyl transferase component Bud32
VLLSAVTLFQMYVSIRHLDLDIGGATTVSKFVPRRPNHNGGDVEQEEYNAAAGAAARRISTTRNDHLRYDDMDYYSTSPPLAAVNRPTTTSSAAKLVQNDEGTIVAASQRLDKRNEKDKGVVITSSSTITTNPSMRATTTQPQPMKSRRIVHLDHDGDRRSNGSSSTSSSLTLITTSTSRRAVEPLSDRARPPRRDDSNIWPFERPYYRDCTYIDAAMTITRPTCNLLHELPTTNNDDLSLISTKGSWRSVWGWSTTSSTHTTTSTTTDTANTTSPPSPPLPNNIGLIVKRLRLDREWNHEAYERHLVDAMAMEQLTSSPYICNLYASCGPSVITERATGNARYFLKNPNLSALQRLELARDLATGLADVHAAHFIHHDLNVANVLEVNGRLKLNDFNIGLRMRRYKHNDTICPIPVRFEAPLWKSPEEIRNSTYVDGYATDVYGMGNLLFQVLTKRQPWTHLEEPFPLNKTEVISKKLAGGLPTLPKKYTEYSGAAIVLGQAAMACFRETEKRPTARTLADILASAVRFFKTHPNAYLDLPPNLFDRQ